MKNDFARNIKDMRLQKGLLQKDIADKLNTTQRKISYWERGTVEPDLDTLIDIAEFFGVTVDELIKKE